MLHQKLTLPIEQRKPQIRNLLLIFTMTVVFSLQERAVGKTLFIMSEGKWE